METWGIIGGGIMGMRIAMLLKEKGYDVTIMEADSKLGGLTKSWEIDKYTWDRFYHIILPDDIYTLNLINAVGLSNELEWSETKSGFFIEGNYYSMSNTLEFIKFPPLNIIDKFRLGLTIILGSSLKNYSKLELVPVSDWLIKWSGKRTYKFLWEPLLKAKLGKDFHKASAAFICATIKRLYGARKKGAKKELFGYVKGGYEIILKSLKEHINKLNIEVLTDSRITDITKKDGAIVVKAKKEYTFDNVIITLPTHIAANVCQAITSTEKDKLKNISYLGVICCSMLLKKDLSPYYITNIVDSQVPFTGIIEMTALVDKSHFGGNSLVYLPRYINSRDEIFNRSNDDLKSEFVDHIKKMRSDLKDEDIISVQMAKAQHVMTLPELNYSNKIPDYKTSVDNLYIINSSFITDGTLNVNESLKIAEKYLDKVFNSRNKL